MSGKNALKAKCCKAKNAKLKCSEFSIFQKREIKMQQKLSVLQYLCVVTELFAICIPVFWF